MATHEEAAYILQLQETNQQLRSDLAAAKAEIAALVKVLGDKGDTIREKDKKLAAAREEIKQLTLLHEAQTNEWHKAYEIGVSAMHKISKAEQQLAAHQLVIKQLREALSIAMVGGDYLPTERSQLNNVLALQPTTEALDAYVQRAVEQEREACAALCESINFCLNDGIDGDWEWGQEAGAKRCTAAIRARKS